MKKGSVDRPMVIVGLAAAVVVVFSVAAVWRLADKAVFYILMTALLLVACVVNSLVGLVRVAAVRDRVPRPLYLLTTALLCVAIGMAAAIGGICLNLGDADVAGSFSLIFSSASVLMLCANGFVGYAESRARRADPAEGPNSGG